MCRLLGLNAGREPVSASFWLVDAPDSLEVQSHRNVDGSGIGFFDPAGRTGPRQAARARLHRRRVPQGGQARQVGDLRRARPLCHGGRPDPGQHSSVRDARPDHGAQRRVRRTGQAGGTTRQLPRPGPRRHRLRALLRADHPADRRPRRRRGSGDRGGGPVDRRAAAGLLAERHRRGRRRALGAALSRAARAAHPRAARRGEQPGRHATPPPACTPAARPPRCTHRNCTRFLRSSWHRRNSTASTAGACSRPANWSTCAPT